MVILKEMVLPQQTDHNFNEIINYSLFYPKLTRQIIKIARDAQKKEMHYGSEQ